MNRTKKEVHQKTLTLSLFKITEGWQVLIVKKQSHHHHWVLLKQSFHKKALADPTSSLTTSRDHLVKHEDCRQQTHSLGRRPLKCHQRLMMASSSAEAAVVVTPLAMGNRHQVHLARLNHLSRTGTEHLLSGAKGSRSRQGTTKCMVHRSTSFGY